MTLDIVQLDVYDDAQYAAYYAVYADAERADRGEDADTWTLTEARAELRQKSSTMQRTAYAGLDDGVLVVAAWLALPLKDNLHRANLGLYVA
ncbi:MAG: PE-PGRS family protein, partial [Candidatus Dormibacteraeota bacterium]|nr:PE-PGRS family protein [Candidatus Dormibacteraeota bacterium]